MKRTIEMPIIERRNGWNVAKKPRPLMIPMEEPVPSGREVSTPAPSSEAIEHPIAAPFEPCPPPPEDTVAPPVPAPARPEATPKAIRDLAVMMLEEDPERVLDPPALEKLTRAHCTDQLPPADLTGPVQEAIGLVKRRWASDPDELKSAKQKWLMRRFEGYKEGRLPFPALNPIKDLARTIFGTAVDQRDIAAARVQELGAWAVNLRYLAQLQNELDQLGIHVDCAKLVKDGKLHAVESSGRTFSSKAALLLYFSTLPDPEPAIAAYLRDGASEVLPAGQDEHVAPGGATAAPPAPEPVPQAVAPPSEPRQPRLPQDRAARRAEPAKVSSVGLAAEVTAALRQVIDRKNDGEILLTSEVTPLVLDAYERKYGRQLDRSYVLCAVNGKFKEFERAGLIRLAHDRKLVGGAKTWAVVKPRTQPAAPLEVEPDGVPAPPSVAEPVVPPEPVELLSEPAPAVALLEAQPAPAAAATSAEDASPAPEHRPAVVDPELERALADNAALRQRVAELEEELRQARQKIRLNDFFAHLRESGMRVVIEAEKGTPPRTDT